MIGGLQALNDKTAAGFAAMGAAVQNLRLRSLMLEDFLPGVGIGDYVADTAALALAAATPNAILNGKPGVQYYIAQGVQPAANFYLGKISFKLKMGAGGFNSKELDTDRYSLSKLVFLWANVEGGGWSDVEFSPDLLPGLGGDYFVTPIAVFGGAATLPFRGGNIYCHHLTLMQGAVIFNSVGQAGYGIGDLTVEDCGTAQSGQTWWTRGGAPTAVINPTGIIVDGDMVGGIPSASPFSFGNMRCRGLLLTGAALAYHRQETDFITLAGVGVNTQGGVIASIDASDTGEVVDCQMQNVHCPGGITARRVETPLKFIHGAQNCDFGPVRVYQSRVAGVYLAGSTIVARDTFNNEAGPVSGEDIAEWPVFEGTLSAGGPSTFTLPVGASPYTNDATYVLGGATIYIVSGTGAGQERVIASYDGPTRVGTISGGAWAVQPNATSVFKIFATDHRTTVLIAGEGIGKVKNNAIQIGTAKNGGYRVNNVYCNLALANSQNVVLLDQDGGGYTSQPFVPGAAGAVSYRPGLKTLTGVQSAVNQVVAGVTTAVIVYGTVNIDARSEWVGASNRWVCQVPGIYKVESFQFYTVATSGAECSLALRKNGATYATDVRYSTAPGEHIVLKVTQLIACVFGDVVDAVFTNGGAGAVTLNSGQVYSGFSVEAP